MFYHFPRDQWESLLPGTKTKHEVVNTLKSVSRRTQAFLRDLHRLRRSPLVRFLNQQRPINPRDLLALGSSPLTSAPDLRDCEFRTLLELPQAFREVLEGLGIRQSPDRAALLSSIYKHIHERCGQWHDTLVADVLNDVEPGLEEPPATADSLKMWRKRHCLAD